MSTLLQTSLLQGFVDRQAERRPDAIAIVMGPDQITYGELARESDRFAQALRNFGCQEGDRICFLIPKSLIAYVTMLGILKAGCVYVPLDPASPAARLSHVVDASEPAWILAAGPVQATIVELLATSSSGRRLQVGWLDEHTKPADFVPGFTLDDVRAQPGAPVVSSRGGQDAAHILFTSGSTGVPKGVVITHANVIHFVRWAVAYFGMSESDRISGHSALHFDLSTYDTFGTFAAGGTLYPIPPDLNFAPPKLADFIRTSRLTQWFSVPSILGYMAKFDVLARAGFPDLERLIWCGEVFPTPTLRYWMERLPNVTCTNLYGPTEATIASSYYTLPQRPETDTEPIPIGRPCPGEELLVLDADAQPVPPGQVGDLYIAGVGLSPGYWRDPGKTAAAFRPHPEHPDTRIYRTGDLARIGENQLVFFHGRNDSQIKARGYRIELGEIETAVHTLDDLCEAAVVAIETTGFEGHTICCAYARVSGADITPVTIRSGLTTLLPSYMLPSRWLELDRLPKNPNGKIDRPALRSMFRGARG